MKSSDLEQTAERGQDGYGGEESEGPVDSDPERGSDDESSEC